MSQSSRNQFPAPVDYTSISKALAVISGKWRLYLILLVGEHTFRFRELRELVPAISEKMLASELKALVALGVFSRTMYAEIPARVDYSLTPNGLLVLPILRQLQQVGQIFN